MFSLLRRLAWYLGRRKFDAELAEEMDFHRSLSEANGAEAGEAARRLGNRAQIAEASRAAWSFAPVEELIQDVKYSLRVLRARPGFALASTLTLALGVGATAALASVLDAVLLRPLPYRESERMVQLLEVNVPRNRTQTILSPANALAWRDRVRVTLGAVVLLLAGVAGFAALGPSTRAARVEPLMAMRTSLTELRLGRGVSDGAFRKYALHVICLPWNNSEKRPQRTPPSPP